MDISKIRTFIESLQPVNLDEENKSINNIIKVLNKEFYDIDDDMENLLIVGSLGRGTAVKGVSDIDILFILPQSIYIKYNNYAGNGQSQLLSYIRSVLQSRYPNTDIKGDGQVVCIYFNKYTVELVPAFTNSDDSFTFADTHDGGSWKKTNPRPEIAKCKELANKWSNYILLCQITRAWKNHKGFKFGGLLIDTLVYNFLDNEKMLLNRFKGLDSFGYLIYDFFEFLSNEDKERTYWNALGSNQQVYNSDNGKFIKEASKALEYLNKVDLATEELYEALKKIFGKRFRTNKLLSEMQKMYSFRNNEEFIENLYPVDIKHTLKIDCDISKNGTKFNKLSYYLKNGITLPLEMKLEFDIMHYGGKYNKNTEIYWKVKNEGREAYKLNQVRGELKRTNLRTHSEQTSFTGEHYVECYIVENGVCVARDRITVPIK